jgi:DNA-binding PadR family transcriptional regulator
MPESLRSNVFHILLALAQGPRHGLGIAEAVDEATDGTLVLGPGTLYRSLKEMVRDGLIVDAPAPEGEDPRRRFHSLTEPGRVALQQEASRMESIVDRARRARVLPETP